VWKIRACLGIKYFIYIYIIAANSLQRLSQVRAYLENEHMPVYDAPEDDGDYAPRQSYNFAPGYHGVIYRADTPDWGARPRHHKKGEGESDEQPPAEVEEESAEPHEVRYKLQSMKWGLIPFWTKRNPDYGSMMKTINCRDDSLIENKGMWTTMKQKKRCIVLAQGFYEWLKKGKDKVPHYVKRKDGKLMCFAGLWDCVQYEGLVLIII
jgi:putative SOS response-associated peptidase YedK